MTVEMAGQRSLAPHFGSSYYIWTNIIAIILAALSMGYYFGGRLADRFPKVELLLGLVAAGGVLCLLIPFFVGFVGDALVPDGTGIQFSFRIIFLGSFVASLILFAPPVFLLAMVTPFLTRLLATGREDVGRSAGLVVALSTVGSIVGTFLPTLFLVPLLGTRLTIVVAAATLVAMAVAGLIAFGRPRLRRAAPLLLLLPLPAFAVDGLPIKGGEGVIEEGESRYQFVQVRQAGDETQLVLNEGLETWHSVLKEGRYLTGRKYYDYFNLIPLHFDPDRRPRLRILVIGSAAGTISRQIHHFFSGPFDVEIDGVEIDPLVVEMGEKYFELGGWDQRNLRNFIFDGRTFLRVTDRTYDLIFVDAYSQQIYIPFYMTTEEFFGLVQRRLRPRGLISINVCDFGEAAPSLGAIRATMARVFGHVHQVAVAHSINFLLYARTGDATLDEDVVRRNLNRPAFCSKTEWEELRSIVEYCLHARKTYEPAAGDRILTDDDAPIEALMDKTFREVRSRLRTE
jgi:spermidine synthase